MSKGKFANKRRKNNSSKLIVALLTIVLVLSIGIGGTLAWLTAQTTEVTNTFTTSDIGVKLEETKTDFKMIPGWTIDKDPKAWVVEGSEDAYLFVTVTKSENFDTYMTYEIAEGWTELEAGVYYRTVTSTQMGEENKFSILKGDKVTVKDTVTKEMMEAAVSNQPTLTFQAYAVQYWMNNETAFSAEQAWAQAK